MKEIVVISGKGGTGKTSLAASFACLEGRDVVVADCDVDAADMHLLMQPDFNKREDFYSGELAKINQDECIRCGNCADICRFNAISIIDSEYIVDPLDCEGCGYCARICTSHAIGNEKLNAGEWFLSSIKTGSLMVHARLGIGADNSGKLVAKVKKEAREIAKRNGIGLIIIDGPPGIGCPVISSITGANFAVLVTEPTISGLHDLKRAYELVKKFNIRAGCIINKSDLNTRTTEIIEDFLKAEDILHISNLPYDEIFTESMTYGQAVIEYTNNDMTGMIKDSWHKIKQIL
ncbi:MAG: (4Fe-4S)-binding protein [Bacteroides sp. SM23_62]|nr:MAG: (4Fe-4S)-binding protein [Bacteroides sp. SM23_62]